MSSIHSHIFQLFQQGRNKELLETNWGFREIEPQLLSILTHACVELSHTVPWNEYNDQRYCGFIGDGESVIKLPSMPRPPMPFKSWAEFKSFQMGGLKDLEYEPKGYKLKYVTTSTYTPDAVDYERNDRLIFEQKGVITDLGQARKYILVAKQNAVHFIFVLQEPGIYCPWAKKRQNGSRMTLEEWCTKEGFDYCYEGHELEFRNSERYLWLIDNFGKRLGTLKDQLASEAAKMKPVAK